MADGIIAGVSSHEDLLLLAGNSSVPVINAMTDREHPCQVLAGYKAFGRRLTDITVAYVGDAGNNVTNSLTLATQTLKMPLHITYSIAQRISFVFQMYLDISCCRQRLNNLTIRLLQ